MAENFYVNQLNKLKGYKIVTGVLSPPDEWGREFFGLLLQKGNTQKILWILMDDEGNGPGSFEIQNPQEVK